MLLEQQLTLRRRRRILENLNTENERNMRRLKETQKKRKIKIKNLK
jgi:hypothetical protein